ncbi:hypothetical protein [Rhodanobacter aciditrophus]|uniref:hypothetical protein n=1 Tax=Rhodanobacter aciditrophus TaxID=1623218 RepID=UPI003CF24E23
MTYDLTSLARRDGLNVNLIVSSAVLDYLMADGDETHHWKCTLRAVFGAIEARDAEGNGTALVTLSGVPASIRVFIALSKLEDGIKAVVCSTTEMLRHASPAGLATTV